MNQRNRISRRRFLSQVGTALTIPTLAYIAGSSNASAQEQTGREYVLIAKQTVSVFGCKVSRSEFEVEKGFWNDLPQGLNEKEFYDRLKNAEAKSTIVTLFPGILFVRGPTSYSEVRQQFLESADMFMNYPVPELDKDLRFGTEDKTRLETMLDSSLKQVREYPKDSRIVLVYDSSPRIEAWVPKKGRLVRAVSYDLTDQSDRITHDLYKRFSFVTKNPYTKKVPITDEFFSAYKNRA